MRSDHATPETGFRTLAAHMVTAEPRRSLWSPETEPMGFWGYVAATILGVAAAAIFVLAWAGSPS